MTGEYFYSGLPRRGHFSRRSPGKSLGPYRSATRTNGLGYLFLIRVQSVLIRGYVLARQRGTIPPTVPPGGRMLPACKSWRNKGLELQLDLPAVSRQSRNQTAEPERRTFGASLQPVWRQPASSRAALEICARRKDFRPISLICHAARHLATPHQDFSPPGCPVVLLSAWPLGGTTA